MKNAKFKVGDLILLPQENTSFFDYNDYGVIFKVEAAGKGFDELIHYHIYWAIDQTDTIEDDTWVHKNMQLIARA
jgi:hypothetical protein